MRKEVILSPLKFQQISTMIKKLTVFSALALCSQMTQVQAEVYKWVDEKGVTHYGEKPPTHQQSEKLKIRKAPPTAAEAQKKLQEKRAAREEQAKAKPEFTPETETQQKADIAKLRSERCKQAKDNLKLLNQNPRVREQDAEGNIRVMTPEEKQSRTDLEKSNIAQYCSPGD